MCPPYRLYFSVLLKALEGGGGKARPVQQLPLGEHPKSFPGQFVGPCPSCGWHQGWQKLTVMGHSSDGRDPADGY